MLRALYALCFMRKRGALRGANRCGRRGAALHDTSGAQHSGSTAAAHAKGCGAAAELINSGLRDAPPRKDKWDKSAFGRPRKRASFLALPLRLRRALLHNCKYCAAAAASFVSYNTVQYSDFANSNRRDAPNCSPQISTHTSRNSTHPQLIALHPHPQRLDCALLLNLLLHYGNTYTQYIRARCCRASFTLRTTATGERVVRFWSTTMSSSFDSLNEENAAARLVSSFDRRAEEPSRDPHNRVPNASKYVRMPESEAAACSDFSIVEFEFERDRRNIIIMMYEVQNEVNVHYRTCIVCTVD